jgi:uncharacterized protein YqiB (DUF1249 family)
MPGDQLCAVSWRARPGSFVGLMTLYESNYIRLGWLVGDPRALAGTLHSRSAADCELRLDVLERGPYTPMRRTLRSGSTTTPAWRRPMAWARPPAVPRPGVSTATTWKRAGRAT